MTVVTAIVLALLASTIYGDYSRPVAPSPIAPASHLPRHLSARNDEPASDETWNRATCSGALFVRVFPMGDEEAGKQFSPKRDKAQSRWGGDLKEDLKKWGWSESKLPKSVCEFDEFALGTGWLDAAKELGISTEGWRDIWCYRFTHGTVWNVAGDAKYQADGKDYPYTGAYAQFGINAHDGAIFAMDNLSPSSAIKMNKQRDAHPDELPALRSLSDLFWGGWYRGSQPETSANTNLRNVKYLISVSVTNQESLSIIQRALSAKGKTAVSNWPGDTFDMSTEEGKALLGSANGKRWGYLLTQRKNTIGIKNIDRVSVFQGKAHANPIMIFYIK